MPTWRRRQRTIGPDAGGGHRKRDDGNNLRHEHNDKDMCGDDEFGCGSE